MRFLFYNYIDQATTSVLNPEQMLLINQYNSYCSKL